MTIMLTGAWVPWDPHVALSRDVVPEARTRRARKMPSLFMTAAIFLGIAS